MKNYTEIKATLETIINNKNTVSNIIAYFGGENRFHIARFGATVDFRNDELQLIRGVGKVTADKIVSAFAGKIVYKYVPVNAIEALTQKIKRLTLKFDDNNGPQFSEDCITYRESEMIRYIKDLGADRLQTISTIPADADIGVQMALGDFWEYTIEKGIDKDAKHFVPYDHGTNGAKRNKVNWIDEAYYALVEEWQNCGCDRNALFTVPKNTAYRGLLEPATKRFEASMDKLLVPERMCIMHGAAEVYCDVDYKLVEGEIVHKVKHGKWACKFGDGIAMVHFSKKLIDATIAACNSADEIVSFLAGLAALKDHTLRIPWGKGLAITFCDFHSFLHDEGINKLPDGRDIDDVVLLMDDTVFKAPIGDKKGTGYKDWNAYVDAFHKYGHHYVSLLNELPSTPKDLPYQQLQCLFHAHPETIKFGANKEVKKLTNMRQHKYAAGALDGVAKKIGKYFPEIADVRFFREAIAHKYETLRNDALGGSAHTCTQFHFCAPDPIAVLQIWFGLPVTGCGLKIDQVLTSCGLHGAGILSRNPCFDPSSICEVEFVDHIDGKYAKYLSESSTYVIAYGSPALQKMDADCDGDDLFGSTEKWIVAATKETLDKYGRFVVVWNAPGNAKTVITRAKQLAYFASLTSTDELGLTCDNLSISIAHGSGSNPDVLAWFKMAGNVLVDASKHGGMPIVMPFFVQNYVQFRTNDDKIVRYPLPKAVGQAKVNAKKAPKNVSRYYSASPVDVFAKQVCDNTAAEFGFTDECEKAFDYRVLMTNPRVFAKTMPGLFNNGTAAKNFEDAGLFIKLCRQTEAEWRSLKEDDEYICAETYDQWKAQQFRKILGDYAAKFGFCYDDVYDQIIKYMFTQLDKQMVSKSNRENPYALADIIWRNGLRLISEDILRVMKDNLNKAEESKQDETIVC